MGDSLRIGTSAIPHANQRYDTCGDWAWSSDALAIIVSRMPDWRMMALVAVHELVEAVLCRHRGITDQEVDRFDMDYEFRVGHEDYPEPGDHPDCPYREEHFAATTIERILAAELGVDWNDYTKVVEELQ